MMTFFFFQAEDGIRDKLVTGVQTCALPIFAHTAQPSSKFKRPRQQVVSRRELGPCRLRRQPRARLPSKDVGPQKSPAQLLPRSRGQPLHLCQPSSALLWGKGSLPKSFYYG